MSNIIDFNKRRREQIEEKPVETVSMDALLRNLTALPKNELMASAAQAVQEKITRLLILTDIASKASDLLSAYGFDPNSFRLDEDSLNRYLSGEMDEGPEALWNGPFFDWDADDGKDTTVRVVTTIRTENGVDEEGDVSLRLGLEIFKLGDGDDNWWRFNDGEWVNDGPPADLFDCLDYMPLDDDGEDFWDDGDEDDDDEDEDDWDDDDDGSIYMYDFGDRALRALTLAGYQTVDQVQALTDEQLAAIPGLDERSLARIRRVLDFLED